MKKMLASIVFLCMGTAQAANTISWLPGFPDSVLEGTITVAGKWNLDDNYRLERQPFTATIIDTHTGQTHIFGNLPYTVANRTFDDILLGIPPGIYAVKVSMTYSQIKPPGPDQNAWTTTEIVFVD